MQILRMRRRGRSDNLLETSNDGKRSPGIEEVDDNIVAVKIWNTHTEPHFFDFTKVAHTRVNVVERESTTREHDRPISTGLKIEMRREPGICLEGEKRPPGITNVEECRTNLTLNLVLGEIETLNLRSLRTKQPVNLGLHIIDRKTSR
jgi:hypothetical protein